MLCLGFKRNGQPCTFRGRYNGYCGHHIRMNNGEIVRRQSQQMCINQHCNRRSRNRPFITCQDHNYMEIMNRCYFQYENGLRCTSTTSLIEESYCRNHQLIVNEIIRNMTWGPSRIDSNISYALQPSIPYPQRPSSSHHIRYNPQQQIESIKQKIKKVVLLIETKMFNQDCPICFEHFNLNEEVYELKCKHHYHPKCLDEWIKQKGNKSTCPLDRKKIE